MELIKKVLLTFCLFTSSSCYHLLNTVGINNDRMSSVAATSKKNVGAELLYMSDAAFDSIESSPVVDFYDTLTIENEMKDDKKKAPAQSRTIKFDEENGNDDDIFGSKQFNEGFEKEMKRRENLLARLQDQSRRIARVQLEIQNNRNKYEEIYNNNNIYKPKEKEDFWTGVCRITKSIFNGFLNFFGIRM